MGEGQDEIDSPAAFFFFFPTQKLLGLSPPTRDRTPTPSNESVES